MNEIFYQFKGKKMTLTHLFKAQAIFAWIWVVMFWLAPNGCRRSFGWEAELQTCNFFWSGSINPNTSTRFISWMAPAWVGEQSQKSRYDLGCLH